MYPPSLVRHRGAVALIDPLELPRIRTTDSIPMARRNMDCTYEYIHTIFMGDTDLPNSRIIQPPRLSGTDASSIV